MWLRRDDSAAAPQPFVVPNTGVFEGNDGSWSTLAINIGYPSGQNFNVLASTSSSITWVPGTSACGGDAPQDCPQRRGIQVFAGVKSSGYNPQDSSHSSLVGLYNLQLGTSSPQSIYGSNYTDLNAEVYTDVEGLGPFSNTTPEIDGVSIAAISSTALFMGSLGLNVVPNEFGTGASATFISQYGGSNNATIPSRSYGYTAGAYYHSGNYYSNLVLGGYDASRFKAPSHSYLMSGSNNSLPITVQSIIVDAQGNSQSATLDTSDDSHIFSASIDSTLPYLWLPKPVCDRLESIFGLTYDRTTDLYTINSTARQNNLNSQATITIKLANSPTSANTTEIVLPYGAFDQQASWPIYENATHYFPIRRSQTDVNVLGRAFLQEAYLVVDYDRGNFSLGQAVFPSEVPTPSIVPILKSLEKTHAQKPSAHLALGAIIGIVVAAIVLLILATSACVFLAVRRRYRRKQQEYSPVEPMSAKLGSPVSPDMEERSSGFWRNSNFSEGGRTMTSELPAPHSPNSYMSPLFETMMNVADGFYTRITGQADSVHTKHLSELESNEEVDLRRNTTISELDAKNVVHELPAEVAPKAEHPLRRLTLVTESEILEDESQFADFETSPRSPKKVTSEK